MIINYQNAIRKKFQLLSGLQVQSKKNLYSDLKTLDTMKIEKKLNNHINSETRRWQNVTHFYVLRSYT